jgi:Zn ribbon nucleic-acid-binding protein
MSYERDSAYLGMRNNRNKVNNLVGFGVESKIDFPRCPICLEHWRLTVTEENGIKVGYCQGCGKTIPLETTVNQETGDNMLTPTKYTSKYGSTSKQHSFIISKDKKTKRKQTGSINDALSADDIADISATGIEPN